MSNDSNPFDTGPDPYRAYDPDQARREREEARQQWAPHLDPDTVPSGYHVKGVSVQRRLEDGTLVWQKTDIDANARAQAIKDAFASLCERIPKLEPIEPPPAAANEDLLCVYPMGDPHIGMLAWAPETGESFDLKIAERNLLAAADWLVDKAPPTETAIVLNLGDFFHSDNQSGVTSRSGAKLDVDGRWAKILRVGVLAMCRVVERALEKHQRVVVRNEIGNHDDHSAIMLSIAMDMRYCDNPRVTIDQSPAKYWYHRFGKCLFGSTHGNTVKLRELGEIMAYDRREDWGQTLFRHWYTGHVHHESVKECRGAVVETFRTLAASDAWHAASGYRSGRDMRCDVWHREYGREARHFVGVERLRAGLEGAT
jgi:hypothetical protein